MPNAPAPSTSPKPLDYLAEPLTIGEPDISGPLAVFPLFGPSAGPEYVSFAQGRETAAVIKEVEGGASVNDLVVHNPTGTALLLYEGEEVLGAQQNRTFDVSALIGAGATVTVPVSCVEAGRWDGSRHGEAFAPAPQTATATLRGAKAKQVRASLAAGMKARASQQQVWQEVAAQADRLDVESETGAMHDVFEARRERLGELLGSISLREGQSGALVAIAGRFAVLDWVSRPEVFASLHGPLAQGYALDALEVEPERPAEPDLALAEDILSSLLEASGGERDGIGLGRDLRVSGPDLIGNGVVAGHELVQLTAFPHRQDEGREPAQQTRIRRPSRRR